MSQNLGLIFFFGLIFQFYFPGAHDVHVPAGGGGAGVPGQGTGAGGCGAPQHGRQGSFRHQVFILIINIELIN